jgi:hypothetical protein
VRVVVGHVDDRALDPHEVLERRLAETRELDHEPLVHAAGQRPGVRGQRGPKVRLGADRDQHVAGQAEVQHLLLRDLADRHRHGVQLVLDRPQRAQVRRDRRQLEADRELQRLPQRRLPVDLTGHRRGALRLADARVQLRRVLDQTRRRQCARHERPFFAAGAGVPVR